METNSTDETPFRDVPFEYVPVCWALTVTLEGLYVCYVCSLLVAVLHGSCACNS